LESSSAPSLIRYIGSILRKVRILFNILFLKISALAIKTTLSREVFRTMRASINAFWWLGVKMIGLP
jgi:hypothetical protein